MGALTGNGVVVFSPLDTSYFLMAHLKDVYVKTGDVISRRDAIGTVGNTGNAIYPWIDYHLHFAYKKQGMQCGIEGVLVPQNPYGKLKKSENTSKRK